MTQVSKTFFKKEEKVVEESAQFIIKLLSCKQCDKLECMQVFNNLHVKCKKHRRPMFFISSLTSVYCGSLNIIINCGPAHTRYSFLYFSLNPTINWKFSKSMDRRMNVTIIVQKKQIFAINQLNFFNIRKKLF